MLHVVVLVLLGICVYMAAQLRSIFLSPSLFSPPLPFRSPSPESPQVEELLFVYSHDSPPNIRNDTFTIDIRLAADHQVPDRGRVT